MPQTPAVRLHVVLLRPAIAGNTGTVARTCAAFGARLHVVAPAFDVARDNAVRRGAVGYWPRDGRAHSDVAGAAVSLYVDDRDFAVRGLPLFDTWVLFSKQNHHGCVDARKWRLSDDLTRGWGGRATRSVHVALAFGSESDGLDRVDPAILGAGRGFRCGSPARVPPRAVFLPILRGARSLNLGVAASIALWEAARQLGDAHDAAPTGDSGCGDNAPGS